MVILGLNHYFHDTSACIIRDGTLVVALEQERFSRNKHTTELPALAIAKCLEVAGLGYKDIDVVAVSVDPKLHWSSKLGYVLANAPKSKPFAYGEVRRFVLRRAALNRWFEDHYPGSTERPRLLFVEHHLSHVG